MAEIVLHPSTLDSNQDSTKNPLPQLLQTPSGLAILELQGTINLPDTQASTESVALDGQTSIGRLVFPFYDAQNPDNGTAWMKKVWLYVGKHQRLTGEVKKLPKAVAVIRRRPSEGTGMQLDGQEEAGDGSEQQLEVVEIVKYKILFSSRPEPVT
jgi:chromosome transmission fidelity protein 8